MYDMHDQKAVLTGTPEIIVAVTDEVSGAERIAEQFFRPWAGCVKIQVR